MTDAEIQSAILDMGRRARAASYALVKLTSDQKNAILHAMADEIMARQDASSPPTRSTSPARSKTGLSKAMIDRLTLDPKRLKAVADAVREVATLPDPVGELLTEWTRPNGLHIRKVRVPIGVIGIIFESRPNVTTDAASLCFKTSNATILRGGSEAIDSNRALAAALQAGGERAGLPARQHPAHSLHRPQQRRAHGEDGSIHRPHHSAWWQRPHRKSRLHRPHARHQALRRRLPRLCARRCRPADGREHHRQLQVPEARRLQRAGNHSRASGPPRRSIRSRQTSRRSQGRDPWRRNRLAAPRRPRHRRHRGGLEHRISRPHPRRQNRPGLDEAIAHINHYGSHHTDSIITRDAAAAAERFQHEVDSAVVLHNASTRFNDGGEFGFGAEIGISTDKLHARGPMGLAELCSYKYLVVLLLLERLRPHADAIFVRLGRQVRPVRPQGASFPNSPPSAKPPTRLFWPSARPRSARSTRRWRTTRSGRSR
jgi:glutamate-5-semialdehyde dehydrogenase